MIPEEAVDAAWEQARADADGYPYPERDEIRRILEAAAPHMLAGAWDEGIMRAAEVAWEHDASASSAVSEIPNPHRPTP